MPWGRSSSSCSPAARLPRRDDARNPAPGPRARARTSRARSIPGSIATSRRSCSNAWRSTRTGATTRPQALAEDLERWLADLPIHARPVTPFHRAVKWVRRRPTAAALVLAASLAVLSTAAAIRGYSSAARFRGAFTLERRKAPASQEALSKEEIESYPGQLLNIDHLLANTDIIRDDPDRIAALLDDCPPRLRGWEWGYLKKRLSSEILTISGHSGFVCGSDFRPGKWDGRCASELPQNSIWDPGDGMTKTRLIHGPDSTSYGTAIDRTGTRLALAGSDGQVKIWNVVHGQLDMAFRATRAGRRTSHSAPTAASSPPRERTASCGSGMCPPTLSPSQPARSRRGSSTGKAVRIFAVAWSAEGNQIAAAGKDGSARIWNLGRLARRAR